MNAGESDPRSKKHFVDVHAPSYLIPQTIPEVSRRPGGEVNSPLAHPGGSTGAWPVEALGRRPV